MLIVPPVAVALICSANTSSFEAVKNASAELPNRPVGEPTGAT